MKNYSTHLSTSARTTLTGDSIARHDESLFKLPRVVTGFSAIALAVSALLLVGCGGGGGSSANASGSPPSSSPSDPSDSPSDPSDPSSPSTPPHSVCSDTGLASGDVAGQCRSTPTTMGALEAGDGTGTSATAVAATQTAARSLQVSWRPTTGDISGYMVYFGKTGETANVFVSDLSTKSGPLNPSAPSVTYNSASDLGLYAGDSVCFRIHAYDAVRALSDNSTLVCTAV